MKSTQKKPAAKTVKAATEKKVVAKAVKETKAAPAKKASPAKKSAPVKAKAAPERRSAAKAAKKELKEVVFNVYSPDSKQVEVAGEFNDWTPAKMKKGEQGVWSLKKKLAAGTYQYKFVFDGSWEIDQANPDRVPDGQGGENSIKNV